MAKNKHPMQSKRSYLNSVHNKIDPRNSFGLLDQVGEGDTILPPVRSTNFNAQNESAFPKPKVGPGRPKADPLSKVSDPEVRSIFRS